MSRYFCLQKHTKYVTPCTFLKLHGRLHSANNSAVSGSVGFHGSAHKGSINLCLKTCHWPPPENSLLRQQEVSVERKKNSRVYLPLCNIFPSCDPTCDVSVKRKIANRKIVSLFVSFQGQSAMNIWTICFMYVRNHYLDENVDKWRTYCGKKPFYTSID